MTALQTIETKSPFYVRLITRLSEIDRQYFNEFARFLPKDKDEAEKRINRMFLDKQKPKNWKEIMELLSVYNTIRFQQGEK